MQLNNFSDVSSPFPDVYDATQVEEGWYKWWKDGGNFSSNVNVGKSKSSNVDLEKSERKTFSVLLPPPNVTGQLHLGHALTATIQDALVRWLVEFLICSKHKLPDFFYHFIN